jgi:hypothetical protein
MSEKPVEPLYVLSIEEVCWGCALVAITLAMHGFGMLAVLGVNQKLKGWAESRTSLVSGLFPVILAGWMIMLVHLTEVMVWAVFFLWKDAFPNASVAYYFALNEYTTVGSKFNLPLNYRLLEGMIGAVGMLTFAWSTGVLFTLAQAFQNRQIESYWLRQRKANRDSEQ